MLISRSSAVFQQHRQILALLAAVSGFKRSFCLLVSGLILFACTVAQAQPYVVLHSFGGSVMTTNGTTGSDGYYPQNGVTLNSAGVMFGTTDTGGQNFNGMIWSLSPSGTYGDLHDFGGAITNADGTTGPDGTFPQAGVTFDSFGNLYGTTHEGGPNGAGMVWEITSSGAYLDLHDFGGTVTNSDGTVGPDGVYPYAGVTFDSSGNIYGTTLEGGAGSAGMVWEITTSGTYFDLHDFGGSITNANGTTGPDGNGPNSSISFDSSGNMYGTTYAGGPFNSSGMVWEITAIGGVYLDLHDFGATVINANGTPGPDGQQPQEADVTFDSSGNMYGTTFYGGPNGAPNGYGILWEITKSGFYKDLHDFGGTVVNANGTSGPDGQQPAASVAFNAAGNMYGTTTVGGPTGAGIVWVLKSGVYKDLHDFGSGNDGQNPYSRVSFDSEGNAYGLTAAGGQNGVGTIWDLGSSSAANVASVTLTPNTVYAGNATTGTVTLTSAAGPAGAVVLLSSNNSGITAPASVTVAAGFTSATFVVNTSVVSTAISAKIAATIDHITVVRGVINVDPKVALATVSLNPPSIIGGTSTTGTVTINEPALAGGVVVLLSSNNGGITVESSVTIVAGATTASFTVNTVSVSTAVSAKISATIDNVTVLHAAITVNPFAKVVSVTLNPATVSGGTSTVGTVTINENAPSAGVVVLLSSNNGGITVQTSVTIPSGSNSATFPVSTINVSSQVTAKIAATVDNVTVIRAVITVDPAPVLTGIVLNPATVSGGNATTGTVTINTPAVGLGQVVYLTSNNGGITVVTSVTILPGATTATFTVNTVPVSTVVSAKIAATLDEINVIRAVITVNPP